MDKPQPIPKIGYAVAAVVVVAVLLASVRLCVIRIRPGEVGVRTDVFTGGLAKKDFGPGWHRDFGPLHQWVIFDSTVQTLELSQQSFRPDDPPGDQLAITTNDGNKVSVDVTVKYRIKEGGAHVLYQKKGASKESYRRTFQESAIDACRRSFGKLLTEDFYSPEKKMASCEEAKGILQGQVDSLALEVIDVLMRRVEFDERYERKIKDKKLADQDKLLSQSLTKAAEKRGETMEIEATTEAKTQEIEAQKKGKIVEMDAELEKELAEIKAEAVKYEATAKAEADLFAAEQRAKGQLLIKQAEAEGERLRNEAMSGPGAEVLIALEAAKNLKLGDTVVSTQLVDFLDIEAITRKLGLPTEKAMAEAAPKARTAKQKPRTTVAK